MRHEANNTDHLNTKSSTHVVNFRLFKSKLFRCLLKHRKSSYCETTEKKMMFPVKKKKSVTRYEAVKKYKAGNKTVTRTQTTAEKVMRRAEKHTGV